MIEPIGAEWDRLISSLPDPHVLQSWNWGEVKSRFGWSAERVVWMDDNDQLRMEIFAGQIGNRASQVCAAALLLKRLVRFPGLPIVFNLIYVPKGPILDWQDTHLRRIVLNDLMAIASKQNSILIKIDPDVSLGTGLPGSPMVEDNITGKSVQADLVELGWQPAQDQIQFRNTVILDLTLSEEKLLAQMKQKTRYNIRLAERKGVVVRQAGIEDLPVLYQMYAETSVRDHFVIREEAYYINLWEIFLRSGLAIPLIAEVDRLVVAGLIYFLFGERSWYMFGMSRDVHRDKMPNYLLQWNAILSSKEQSCKIYDMWGAPDQFNEHDPMWGVYRFKEGLGGEVQRHIGAWDFTAHSFRYRVYNQLLPRILAWMRSRGMRQTRQRVSQN